MIPDVIKIKHISLLDRLTAGQSMRYRLPVLLTDNTTVTCYFTEISEKPRTLRSDSRELLYELYDKYGEGAKILTAHGMMHLAGLALKSTAASQVENGHAALAVYDWRKLADYIKKAVDIYKKTEEGAGLFGNGDIPDVESMETPLEFRAFLEYTGRLRKILMYHSINSHLGISSPGLQSLRNCAMSYTAELLGIGNLLAYSKPVEVLIEDDGNGESMTLKGTAMMPAKGKVFADDELDTNAFRLSITSFENCPGLNAQVADMQVLDFLCGNSDRHLYNMSLTIDENGKVREIQGIDNDSSFGEFFDYTNPKFEYTCDPYNMGIMTAELAEKVETIDLTAYCEKLSDYGIGEREIAATRERFELMRQVIKECRDYYKDIPGLELRNGHTRIVSRMDADSMSFLSELSNKSGRSLFGVFCDINNKYQMEELVYLNYKRLCGLIGEICDAGYGRLSELGKEELKVYELERDYAGCFLTVSEDKRDAEDFYLGSLSLGVFAKNLKKELQAVNKECDDAELKSEAGRQLELFGKIEEMLSKHNNFVEHMYEYLVERGKADKEILEKLNFDD